MPRAKRVIVENTNAPTLAGSLRKSQKDHETKVSTDSSSAPQPHMVDGVVIPAPRSASSHASTTSSSSNNSTSHGRGAQDGASAAAAESTPHLLHSTTNRGGRGRGARRALAEGVISLNDVSAHLPLPSSSSAPPEGSLSQLSSVSAKIVTQIGGSPHVGAENDATAKPVISTRRRGVLQRPQTSLDGAETSNNIGSNVSSAPLLSQKASELLQSLKNRQFSSAIQSIGAGSTSEVGEGNDGDGSIIDSGVQRSDIHHQPYRHQRNLPAVNWGDVMADPNGGELSESSDDSSDMDEAVWGGEEKEDDGELLGEDKIRLKRKGKAEDDAAREARHFSGFNNVDKLMQKLKEDDAYVENEENHFSMYAPPQGSDDENQDDSDASASQHSVEFESSSSSRSSGSSMSSRSSSSGSSSTSGISPKRLRTDDDEGASGQASQSAKRGFGSRRREGKVSSRPSSLLGTSFTAEDAGEPKLRTTKLQHFLNVHFQQHLVSLPPAQVALSEAVQVSVTQYFCHTLMLLSGPVTLQGPCVCIGLSKGEVNVGGFILGNQHLHLPSEQHRAVAMPLSNTKKSLSSAFALPSAAVPPIAATLLRMHGVSSSGMDSLTESSAPPAASASKGQAKKKKKGPVQKEEKTTAADLPIGADGVLDEQHSEYVTNLLSAVDWDWVEKAVLENTPLLRDNRRAAFLVLQSFNHLSGDDRRILGRSRDLYNAFCRTNATADAPFAPRKLHRRAYIVPQEEKRSNNNNNNNNRRGVKRGRGRTQVGNKSQNWRNSASPNGDDDDERVLSTDVCPQTGNTRTYMMVPSCIARIRDPGIDLVLLPKVLPSVLRDTQVGSVAVMGSVGVGKSTLTRFLANGLLSMYGACYWMDVDLGQPEFGMPGTVSIFRIRAPLLRPHDITCVDEVVSFYVGCVSSRCPVTSSTAVAALCHIGALIQLSAPMVINTHGWVLGTGRRLTVEALRRLQPLNLIHLQQDGEEAWVTRSVVFNPLNGLNSTTLANRFVVRKESAVPCSPANEVEQARRKRNREDGSSAQLAVREVVQLMHPYDTTAMPHLSARCSFHTISVHRQQLPPTAPSPSKSGARGVVAPANAASERRQRAMFERRARWNDYFASLIACYRRKKRLGERWDALLEDMHALVTTESLVERGEFALRKKSINRGTTASGSSDGAAPDNASSLAGFDGSTEYLSFSAPKPSADTNASTSAVHHASDIEQHARNRQRLEELRVSVKEGMRKVTAEAAGLAHLQQSTTCVLRVRDRDIGKIALFVDDVSASSAEQVLGSLEHSVVALSFSTLEAQVSASEDASSSQQAGQLPLQGGTATMCLRDVGTGGFPLLLFGIVQASESELKSSLDGRHVGESASSSVVWWHEEVLAAGGSEGIAALKTHSAPQTKDGWISIALPCTAESLRGKIRAAVANVPTGFHGRHSVSLACAPEDRFDTSFLEMLSMSSAAAPEMPSNHSE